jgi:hypothetical protein
MAARPDPEFPPPVHPGPVVPEHVFDTTGVTPDPSGVKH